MTRSSKSSSPRPRRAAAEPRLSRTRQPESMSVEDWQASLRRQFGREQPFVLERLGADPEFLVRNPKSKGCYRVAIRGRSRGQLLLLPRLRHQHLGTCKHIEFTLGQLLSAARRQGGSRAASQPPYSEIYLSYYGARRDVRFRAGTECPPSWSRLGRNAASTPGHADGALDASTISCAPRPRPGMKCAVTTTRAPSSPSVRDAERRRRVLAEAFPKGVAGPALQQAAEGAAVRLPGARARCSPPAPAAA